MILSSLLHFHIKTKLLPLFPSAKRLAFICPLFSVFCLLSPPALAGTLGLVVHSETHETLADGALAARYRLSFQGENPFHYCQDMQIFWRPGGIFKPGTAWFPLPARCDAESCGVEIRVDGMVFFTLLAQARCDGVLYQAQTIDSLHAVNIKPKEGAAPLTTNLPAPIRPALALLPASSHYFPQTGMTFSFHYQPAAAGGIEVSTNDHAALLSDIDERGDFQFTPSHEQALNRQGFEATSERIIQVREGRTDRPVPGLISTFTLNVHRSRYAFLRPKSGIALFIGVALAGAALVFALKKQSWRR